MMGISGEWSARDGAPALSFTFLEMCKSVEAWLAGRDEALVEDYRIRLARESGGPVWLSIDAQRCAVDDGRIYYEAYVNDITRLK